MEYTKNLLLELYNTTTDKSVPVITWRSSVNGEVNSAFVKIDDAFGELKEQMTKISGSAIKVEAIGDGLGNFMATGIDKIESYKKDDVIALIPNEDCVGNSMININGLGNKSLMKVDNSGALVILEKGDLKAKHEYYFRYNGSVFVWQIGTSAEQLNYLATNSTLEATNVKDAIDELDAKSEFLCQTLGYLSPNTFTNINEITLNGKYIGKGEGLPTTDDFWVVDVTAGNYVVTEDDESRVEKYARQTAYKVMDSNGKKTEIAVFTRNRAYDGTWSNWNEFILDDGTADCIPDITIKGRTLVNLLGRSGNAIYKNWNYGIWGNLSYEHDIFKVDKTGTIYDKCNLHTLDYDIGITSGKYYIAIAEIKGDNALISGATTNQIIKNTNYGSEYNICCVAFTPVDKKYIEVHSVSDITYYKNLRLYEITSDEYYDINLLTAEEINEKYPYVDDVKCVVNPYLECDNSRIMFETKLYEGETISRRNDGTYVKNSEWEELTLDQLDFDMVSRYSSESSIGLTAILKTPFDGKSISQSILSAYNGEIVEKNSKFLGNPKDYVFDISINETWKGINLKIPYRLAGWGDSYIPTQEEIKAFFLGWRMNSNDGIDWESGVYNGTGTKTWAKLWCGIGGKTGLVVSGTNTTSLPTVMNDQGYTPYRLIYKKETPTTEEVKTYGGLVIKDGVEVTSDSGLVLNEFRESLFYDNNSYYINPVARTNNYFGRFACSHRVEDILKCVELESFEIQSLTKGILEDMEYNILHGKTFAKINKQNLGIVMYDYLIYKPDTVSSYDYTLTYNNSIKSILNKTQKELIAIATNEELLKTQKELEYTKYELSQRSNPNLLFNGDFQVWQRGTSFSGTSVKYTADRWRYGTDGEIDVKKQPYGVSVTNTKVGTEHSFGQFIEVPKSLKGKTVTLSVKFHTPSNINQFYIGYRKNEEPFKSLYAEFNFDNITYYKKTFTVPETDCDVLWIGMQLKEKLWETIELEWVKLELGEQATPFVPKSYGEELLACQRYYEKGRISSHFTNNNILLNQYLINVQLNSVKRINTPTITIVGYDSTGKQYYGNYNDKDFNIYRCFTEASNLADSFIIKSAESRTVTENNSWSCVWVCDAEIY